MKSMKELVSAVIEEEVSCPVCGSVIDRKEDIEMQWIVCDICDSEVFFEIIRR